MVVVLPCVPDMQIVFLKAFVSIPKKVPLSIIGIFNSLALTSSESSCFTAALNTTKLDFSTFSISWPIFTGI
mgnify:CR=1 FL=1